MLKVTQQLIEILTRANLDDDNYFFKLAYQATVGFTGLQLPSNSENIQNILEGNGVPDGKDWKRVFDFLGENDFKWRLLDQCLQYCSDNNLSFYYSEKSKLDTQKKERCKLLCSYVFGIGMELKRLANHLQTEDRFFVPELLMTDDSDEAQALAKFVTNGVGYDGVVVDDKVKFLMPLFPGDLNSVNFAYRRN